MNTPSKNVKLINWTLWVSQIVIAVMFIMPSFMKMLQPIAELSAMLPWTAQVDETTVRLLGFIDLLGGVGIILPSILRIMPKISVWAAFGNILLMLSAIVFHISRGESSVIGFNIFLIAMLLFIAWGRTKKAPILPKK